MDMIAVTFDRDVPLELVSRPAVEKTWQVFASPGPARTCRPAAMGDVLSVVVTSGGVTATFPGDVVIFVPGTRMVACAGHPVG